MIESSIRPVPNTPNRRSLNMYANFTDKTNIEQMSASLKFFSVALEDFVKPDDFDNVTIAVNIGEEPLDV